MAQKTIQTQNRRQYAICTICHAHNVDREPQWRVYEVDVTPRGAYYRGAMLYAAHAEDDALKWAKENCWNIFACI